MRRIASGTEWSELLSAFLIFSAPFWIFSGVRAYCYYERANKERQKDNMRSKTQAPEPSGSGACFLILSAPPQACQPKKIRDKSKSFQGRAERNWKEIGLALRASGTKWSERPSLILDSLFAFPVIFLRLLILPCGRKWYQRYQRFRELLPQSEVQGDCRKPRALR